MRRNPDLLAVFAIALYVWVGDAKVPAAPRPTSSLHSAEFRKALKSEARNALHEIVASFRNLH